MTPIPLGILDFPTGAAGAYDLLETQVLASSAASVTFTGLDTLAAGYQHLQLRITARRTGTAAQPVSSLLRFNGVTSASYARHRLQATGSSVSSSAAISQVSIELEASMAGGGAPAGAFSASVLDILDFASSSKNTTVKRFTGAVLADGQVRVLLASGLFNNTASITSFTITSEADNFDTGSRFSIYGLKGA